MEKSPSDPLLSITYTGENRLPLISSLSSLRVLVECAVSRLSSGMAPFLTLVCRYFSLLPLLFIVARGGNSFPWQDNPRVPAAPSEGSRW